MNNTAFAHRAVFSTSIALVASILAGFGAITVLAQSQALDCEAVLSDPASSAEDKATCEAQTAGEPAAEEPEAPAPEEPAPAAADEPAPAPDDPAEEPAAEQPAEEAAPTQPNDGPAPEDSEAPADAPADEAPGDPAHAPEGNEPEAGEEPGEGPGEGPGGDPGHEPEPGDGDEEPVEGPADPGVPEEELLPEPTEPVWSAPKPDKPASSKPKPKPDRPAGTSPAKAPAFEKGASKPKPAPAPRPAPEGAGDGTTTADSLADMALPGFQDARTFRENFTPKDRLPELPRLDEHTIAAFENAGERAGSDWSMVSAVAWMESRWGNPVAAGIAGARFDDDAWNDYGVDANGDGSVDRANDSDAAASVANFLAIHTARARRDGVEDPERAAMRAYFGNAEHAERAMYLAAYHDALGVAALEHGLESVEAREALRKRALEDPDIVLYAGGRHDVESNLIDPRVLVTITLLSNRYDGITVSSMISGHGVFTASGNVSLHAYGQGVDIAALGDVPILGNQQADSDTVKALKDVLRMPECMQPRELISLWDLGGASFAMSDHHDHIHVGYGDDPCDGRADDGTLSPTAGN